MIKIRCIVERITYQNSENGYTILARIIRQAQTSRIIMNAHMINQGKIPDTSNAKGSCRCDQSKPGITGGT
ncbi:MAG: hypothetical protein PHX08_21955 [Lachnospiraceae bacterium]|nr:hypothetical protein [Lachnospiraceae bacterium]